LEDILGDTPSQGFKSQYNSIDLLNDEKLFDKMPVVIFQALQINVCYTANTPKSLNSQNNDVSFYKIGTDETGIPIVVTEIMKKTKIPPSAFFTPHERDNWYQGLKKLVISGPHGNERNALFVVLETQKHFIKEAGEVPHNLVLYFVPAISPTFFFADARGLPFVASWTTDGKYIAKKIDYPDEEGSDKQYKEIITTRLKGSENLSIPKLHQLMEENNGALHTNIQEQANSRKPEHGIDANRDYHDVLISALAFSRFIRGLNGPPQNITVFMLHGYDSQINNERLGKKMKGYPYNKHQGAVYSAYKETENKMYLPDDIMKNVDLITLALFGFRYNLGSDSTKRFEYSQKYLFEKDPSLVKYKGEWVQKLYNREIFCFDIELAETYREGTRGKKDPSGKDKEYVPEMVIKRHEKGMPFFQDKTKGKFVDLAQMNITFVYPKKEGEEKPVTKPKQVSLSFYDFLKDYYNLLGEAVSSTEVI
jgi:hypothetical protein